MVGCPGATRRESCKGGLAGTGNFIETVLTEHGKAQTQGRNIRHYTNYLSERARAYRDTKCDFVRGAENRLEKMTVEKGLLRETETVQHQITALLKCDVSKKVLWKGALLRGNRFWTTSPRTKSQ
jgi:hypothetical protein